MVIRVCWESTVIFSRIQIRVTSWWLHPELFTLPAPSPPPFPSLISLMVSVDGKHRERRICVAGSSRGSLSRYFPSTETIRLIRDGKRGGEGVGSGLPLLLPATQLLLSRCFPSTETIRLIRDGKRGGEGAGSVNSSPKRSDPQRLKRPPATARPTPSRRGPRQCEATCVLR